MQQKIAECLLEDSITLTYSGLINLSFLKADLPLRGDKNNSNT